MRTRRLAVAAAGVGAAVLAAAGITYASIDESKPQSPPVQQAAPPVQPAVPAAPPAPAAPAAPAAQQAAPAEAVEGGGGAGGGRDEGRDRDDRGREGRDREGRDREEGGRGHRGEGRIYFNERTYSASSEGCITAASGLGARSFSIYNDSRRTVEVFRGFSCDNGGPVATVGPHSSTNGVAARSGHGVAFGHDGVVGSFRVIREYDEW
ncbi:hypothetical protein [Kitasatospora sp. NPDC087314]|uniref:hypothetical protein n=1 Tax=Kitasatospora sp. NPDC087314 TaxID=3364068 RepID=UPI0038198C7C